MPGHVIIGTAGHIDHGKSALVRALTGIDPDRLKEEKERGITIELGFAHLRLPSGTVAGIVDVPGHERFVRTMVAGAMGIDIVVLVVAADEGIMPQTREHLDICRLLGVPRGLVALTKCDRADADWIEMLSEEIRTFTRSSFLEGSPVVPVSSTTGDGLPRLVEALDALAGAVPGKDPSNFLRLPVDRSFTMRGFGTVVTGTLVGGTVRVGEEAQLLPGGAVARVRGIQVHGGPVDAATAGSRTAVNLQGLDREQAPRGSVLCRPGTLRATRVVEARVELLRLAARPLSRRALASFHAGTASCLARVVPYGLAEIAPGGSGFARIDLDEAMVVMGGDRFILRGFSPLANFGFTIGGGVVAHAYPPARRAAARRIPPALETLLLPDPARRLEAAVEDAGPGGLAEPDAAVVAGIGPAPARKIVEKLAAAGAIRRGGGEGRLWHAAAVSSAGRMCLEALAGLHARNPDREGFPREEIAAAFALPPDPLLVALALEGLSGVSRAGERYFLPAKRPQTVALDSPLARAAAEAIRRAGLAAPSRAELADALKPAEPRELDKTLDALSRSGAVVRIKEFCVDAAAFAALKEKLVAFLEARGEIGVPEFKELTGLTRKHIIPLLEHLDLTKVTLRVGDKRVLRKSK